MSDEKLDTEIRREQIAEAALELIANRGVSQLSIAAVARRVGLVPSGIYRHFKSKEQILLAALDLVESRLNANVQAACEEASDTLDRLRGILMRHVRFIREGRAVPRIILSEDAHASHPERRDRVKRIFAGYLGQIGNVVRQGQHEGTIRTDLDPQTAALLLLGIVIPAGILWHLSEGGFDVTQHAERAWQLVRRALVVPQDVEDA